MKNYYCCRCNKYCSNKSVLRKHLMKKFKCEPKLKNIDNGLLIEKLNEDSYIEYYESLKTLKECIYCRRLYTNNSNLKRHQLACNKGLILNDNSDNKTVNNIINNYNQINNNIFIINNLGKEDISNIDFDKLMFLDKNDYNELSLLNKSNNYVHNLKSIMSDIYNNNSNINFEIINKKEQKCKAKIDDKITKMHFSEIFFIVFDNIVNIYENYLNNNQENLEHYINYLQTMSKQLDIYESDITNKKAKEFFIINNKIKKFLKKTLLWIAEDNKMNI